MNTDKIYAERLVSEYAPKTTRKIKALIRLDKWIKKPAFITAFAIGTLSALVFLFGLILFALIQFLGGEIFGPFTSIKIALRLLSPYQGAETPQPQDYQLNHVGLLMVFFYCFNI